MATVHHPPDTATPASGRLRWLVAQLGAGEPHLARGPFARWPRIADGVLAVVVFVASLFAVAASAIDDSTGFTLGSIADRPAAAFVLLAVAAGALWWRRSYPLSVTAVVLALMIGWALAGFGDGQDIALVVASYSVGRYADDDDRSVATLVAVVAVGIAGTVIDANQRIDIVPAILLGGLPWYVGRRVRNRGDYLTLLQERTERLEAEQLARAQQAVADERARIARELHDVVAHRVSMMTVQAGAAKTVARSDPGAAIEAMGDVQRAGRQALGELRHLLGVLRDDTAEPDHLGPQPGLADVPALVDDLTHAGAEVTLTMADLPDELSVAIDLSAYRIVQESLTNVIKHAGPAPAVEISLAIDDQWIDIDIINTTDGTAPHLPGSGFGLAGMRERATLLGGTLTAAVQPHDRYRVHARLPLESGPT